MDLEKVDGGIAATIVLTHPVMYVGTEDTMLVKFIKTKTWSIYCVELKSCQATNLYYSSNQ